ncbi:MAG: PDGLE domain-containing protein [Chloroflexota bacterium]
MQTDPHPRDRSRSSWVLIALALIVAVVVAAALFASGNPDGLERVAEDIGFLDAAEGSPFSLIADYVVPGMDGPMATIVAGLIGIAVLFGIVWLIGKALARRRA